MLLTILAMAILTAYYWGLKRAGQAAAVTAALCLVALFVPRYATTIHFILAGGAVAIWALGRKRPRPPDAVLAVAWVRRAVHQLRERFGDKK